MATERDRMYGRWYRMRKRCEDPEDKDFHSYGGRGIRVCGRWQIFQFYLEDIERELWPRPLGVYSIDRIDNDGDYAPGNVRWATPRQQSYNSRLHLERGPAPIGIRFGRLLVVAEALPIVGTRRGREVVHRAVTCQCDCGAEATVKLSNLPKTSSCGCYRREVMRELARQRFSRG